GAVRLAGRFVALCVVMLDAVPDAVLVHVGDDLEGLVPGGELHRFVACGADGRVARLDGTGDRPAGPLGLGTHLSIIGIWDGNVRDFPRSGPSAPQAHGLPNQLSDG